MIYTLTSICSCKLRFIELIFVQHISVQSLSFVRLFAMLWVVAFQAPISMGFSRQENWSGFPFSPPGDLPDPEVEATSLVFPALTSGFFTTEPPGQLNICLIF